MASEGVEWLGGPETPPEPGPRFMAWRWVSRGDHPCAWCASMNDHLFVVRSILSHHWCRCRMEPALGCQFVERLEIGETTDWIVEPVGVVPGNGSRSFSESRSGSGSLSFGNAGGGLSVSWGETTTLNNPGDTDITAYAVYSVVETTFCDLWLCHGRQHQEVTRIETRFHTLTTNPSQYE